jgi:hypothetical protein
MSIVDNLSYWASRMDLFYINLIFIAVVYRLLSMNYFSFSIIFSIFSVALMAATVWSESRPRVLNSR